MNSTRPAQREARNALCGALTPPRSPSPLAGRGKSLPFPRKQGKGLGDRG